jgi:hypothetical protein
MRFSFAGSTALAVLLLAATLHAGESFFGSGALALRGAPRGWR